MERGRRYEEKSSRLAGRGDRQMFNRLEAWPLAPLDLGFVHRQLQFRPTPEQSLQRTCSLDARELMAKAKMNSGAEGDMPVRFSLEIEFLRMCICLRIQVCGRQHGHDLLTLAPTPLIYWGDLSVTGNGGPPTRHSAQGHPDPLAKIAIFSHPGRS